MDKNTIHPTSIPSFYAGQSIFLTGATGFIGKAYIEKILRSCPDVREIFVLMRPKKGITIDERLEKMLSSSLYDKLREKQSLNFKKLIPVFGDISQKNLNLSVADRQMLIERVTIIIHNAANVKFNDSLKYAILTNTRSTRDICVLAENMKNLVALVYVSTAYTNLDNPFIEEKVYPPVADWRKMIKVAELLDEHNLNIFTAKCLDNIPNTYLFSKNLAESVIQEYSSSVSCAIVRPSIVTPSLKDPISGWVDNFNGPVGLMIFAGKGLLRVACASNCTSQNDIPVDTVINTIILVTWKLKVTTFTPKSTLFVVNCTFPDEKSISLEETYNILLKHIEKIPLEGIVWTPDVVLIKSLIIYYLLVILWHILPGIIIDSVLKCSRHQPMLLRLQRKVYVTNWALQHFMCNEWKFDNTNSRYLMSLIPSDNLEMFSIDLSDMDWNEYWRNALIGSKKYLLHEDINQLKVAKTHYKRVNLFVATFKTVIAIGMLWMIYKYMLF